MIGNIILGINIDTSFWLSELKSNEAENIIVLDYDFFGEPIQIDGVLYISSYDIKEMAKKFDSIIYYKSLYVFPTLIKSRINNDF